MARDLSRVLPCVNFSSNFVSMEYFRGQQLEDAIKATDSVVGLLEEMKRAISGVKEMKQRVRNRKDNNINMTREVFATLRKAIDEREEQTIDDIKETAYEREKALEVSQVC